MVDLIENPTLYSVGEMTHYGTVVAIPPAMEAYTGAEADQSVVVKTNPSSLTVRPDESLVDKPPSSYNKITFFPIHVDRFGWDTEAPSGAYTILAEENLTIEDVSPLLKPTTFSLWTKYCHVSKDTANALQRMKYAIVHRYTTETNRDEQLDGHSAELIDLTVACLALIRPTRRSRAGKVTGVITNGVFDPQGFDLTPEPVEVPEIQKLFTIGKQHIETLCSVLPEFMQLYQKGATGRLNDDYEPIRMAVQLYEQAYSIHYWKARHILWWAAIEALYGNAEEAAMARIYALFGNKNLKNGYRCSIYEDGDIPSFYPSSRDAHHTVGEMLPLLYVVRNSSAHGQRVSDPHFIEVPHPFGNKVCLIDILAEAATFIIRRIVIEILRQGFREKFKDRDTREDFWLIEYGLDRKQSKKRLREMKESLGLDPVV